MKANDSRVNRTNQSVNYSPGRPRAIPARLIPELLQHRQRGMSWKELVDWLRNTSTVDCSRWAVRRACLGLGVYEHAVIEYQRRETK